MTKRTTDQWEALLDGTADGPWKAERHGNEEVISICTTIHTPKRFVGDIYGEWNAHLAAVAPEAVAEVIRLRKALEGRIRVWEKVADRLAVQVDDGAELMRIALKQITRILEGDNHE